MSAAHAAASAAAALEVAADVLRANGYLQLAQRLDEHDRAQHAELEALRYRLGQVLGDRDALVLQLQLVCDAIDGHLARRRRPAAVVAAVEDARELLAADDPTSLEVAA